MDSEVGSVVPLSCAECGAIDDRGLGWRALLTIDDEVAIYCPDCAREEFGGLPTTRN